MQYPQLHEMCNSASGICIKLRLHVRVKSADVYYYIQELISLNRGIKNLAFEKKHLLHLLIACDVEEIFINVYCTFLLQESELYKFKNKWSNVHLIIFHNFTALPSHGTSKRLSNKAFFML